ncbi:hypothetical protein MOV08_24180 [Streptomyces yunnanensis]|uniref:Uncharacterized protein n=1 Tax=Streptomyces yunnanensis TaxID=156453 RepID=A0ABY8AAN0_9ACTN|nr:hypothetical protein [Streptomyces yunnanensis]WEB42055.1 hypothetical protein MOV08_24180 [Streptomyces yunnanensis]
MTRAKRFLTGLALAAAIAAGASAPAIADDHQPTQSDFAPLDHHQPAAPADHHQP